MDLNSHFWISTRPFKLSTRNLQLVTRVLPYHASVSFYLTYSVAKWSKELFSNFWLKVKKFGYKNTYKEFVTPLFWNFLHFLNLVSLAYVSNLVPRAALYFFRLPLIAKRCVGDSVGVWNIFTILIDCPFNGTSVRF